MFEGGWKQVSKEKEEVGVFGIVNTSRNFGLPSLDPKNDRL